MTTGKTTSAYMPSPTGGPPIELTPIAELGLQIESRAATTMTWWEALERPLKGDRYVRREGTHQRLALLQERHRQAEQAIPDLEQRLAAQNQLVERDAAELEHAERKLRDLLVIESRPDPREFAPSPGRLINFSVLITERVWLARRGCWLHDVEEYRAVEDLRERRGNPRSAEGQAIAARSALSARLGSERRLVGILLSAIALHQEHLIWLDQRDARRHPSPERVAYVTRFNNQQAELLRQGKILGFQALVP